MTARRPDPTPSRGFLSRLAHDTRGNALAIMAAFLIPLAAFSGSAIDMARLYTVRVRLQQACDAGALAGRKSMDINNNVDLTSTGQAQTFFKNNFQQGWFKTKNVSFTPTVTSDYQVAGTASADVPMTLMGMFGQPTKTLTVTCQARYDVADVDVMFVLDTTGSMACTTANDPCGAPAASYTRDDGTTGYYDVEFSGSKISGVRSAVMSFYDTLAASADSSTHIRYGFVPYTSTVNVGAEIYRSYPSYFVSQWQYNTRRAVNDVQQPNSSTVTKSVSATSSSDCATKAYRTPALTYTQKGDGTVVTNYNYTTNGTAVLATAAWANSACTLTVKTVIPVWQYQKWPLDVSNFIAGNAVDDPSKVTSATSTWQGCIEEAPTTASSTFDASALPADLNPDTVPVTDVDVNGFPKATDTRWRPMWPDVLYYRGFSGASAQRTGSSTSPYGDETSNPSPPQAYGNLTYSGIVSLGYYTCGMKARRLSVMNRSDVYNYVNDNDFRPIGGTYHDTGMIWATRFLSPQGIFKSDTAPWPGRQPPNRYIVFMTDGEMAPNPDVYGLYGVERYDGRVTGGIGNSYSANNDLDYHNARFVAECQAAKNRNITVFVVGFGQTLNSQLTACASPGQAYYASDNAGLKAAFQKIAQQVAMLRISK